MKEYVSMIDQYGLWTVAIAVILSVAIPLLKKWAERTTLFTRKTLKQSQLIKHSFFCSMDYWRKIGIDAIEIEEPARDLIFKDFLHIKFRVFDVGMREVVSNKEISKMRRIELKNYITNKITSAIKEYEQFAKDTGIPQVIIKKFSKWHSRSVSFVMDGIEDICMSSFYDNNVARLNGLLSLLLAAFHATIIDAERTLDDLNGDLAGLTYKGLKITH